MPDKIQVSEFETKEDESFDLVMIRKRSNSVVGLDPLDELVKSKEEEKLNRRGSDDNTIETPKASQSNLRDKLRKTLTNGGDISDIDKIFEHVINESKRVKDSLKAITELSENYDPRKSFLAFYETASKGGPDDAMKDFIEVESERKIVKSEAYYCTKHGRVKGLLTVADTYIMYDPIY